MLFFTLLSLLFQGWLICITQTVVYPFLCCLSKNWKLINPLFDKMIWKNMTVLDMIISQFTNLYKNIIVFRMTLSWDKTIWYAFKFNLMTLICFGVRSIDHFDAQKWHVEIIFKNLFFQCRVLRYDPLDTLNTKVLEKIFGGGLFRTPPYIHYSALQCTVV